MASGTTKGRGKSPLRPLTDKERDSLGAPRDAGKGKEEPKDDKKK